MKKQMSGLSRISPHLHLKAALNKVSMRPSGVIAKYGSLLIDLAPYFTFEHIFSEMTF